jgi:hypothetical protein
MSARRCGRRLFWLFFALYALTSSGNAFRVPDEFEVYFQAEHLVDAGDISVPQTLAVREAGAPILFGKFGADGRPYAPYGPGVAYLIAPFHVAGRLVARAAHVPRVPLPEGAAWEFVVGGVTTIAMAFAAALAVAGFYRGCLALAAPLRQSVWLAAILGGATILWPYGTTLYSEAWLAAFFAWAAALLLAARDGGENARARVIGASALLAAAVLTKPTAVVIAPAFVAAILIDGRRGDLRSRAKVALALSAAIAVAAGVHAAWNIHRFGNALDFGYNIAGMIPRPPARSFVLTDVPRGLFVQLLTPGKSLFVWAPATLPALLALVRVWQRERGLAAGLAIALTSALVFYAAFIFPEGGYAHGPRHLVPLVPLLMLPLAIPGIAVSRRALAVCAAIGCFVCALAVTVSFFEDQSPPLASIRTASPYYEAIDPPPGRPAYRYRIDYIPFRFALSSGRWLSADRPAGNGPDFFSLHLAQARVSLPGGRAIPLWMPWAVSVPWIVVLIWAGAGLTSLREGYGSPPEL